MVDRTTNALLLAIAIGLWLNVAIDWLRPVPVHAQIDQLSGIASSVSSVESYVQGIARGTCINSKIC